ncbi:MAG TPA: hypothetical protein VF785_20960 [Gemmatimonadaceae bacterium]
MKTRTLLDLGTRATIVLTLVLFAAALWVKGLTHDILLEAGVFLVSVKLMLMSHKNGAAMDSIRTELAALRTEIEAGPAAIEGRVSSGDRADAR